MPKKQIQTLIIIGALILLAVFLLPRLGLFQQVGTFSIAGERWQCDALPYRGGIYSSGGTADSYYSMAPNSAINSDISGKCSASGVFNTFIDWVPVLESKNSVDFTCPSTATECQVQLYCCNHLDCSSDTDCQNWFGSGYTCTSTTETDPLIEFDWSSWSYCESTTAPQEHRCWGIKGTPGQCQEKLPPYTQDYLDANFGGDCPPSWAYESLQECTDALSGVGGNVQITNYNAHVVSGLNWEIDVTWTGGVAPFIVESELAADSTYDTNIQNRQFTIDYTFPSAGTYMLETICVYDADTTTANDCITVDQNLVVSDGGNGNGNGCTTQDSKKCFSGDVYWYDSCNVKEAMFEDCGTSGCSNGVCVSGNGNGVQTCAQQNGDICLSTETCSGTWLSATESRCCSVTCTAPTNGNGEVEECTFNIGDFCVKLWMILVGIGGIVLIILMRKK